MQKTKDQRPSKDSPEIVALTDRLLDACNGYTLDEIRVALDNLNRVMTEKNIFIKKEPFNPKKLAAWPHLWEEGAWPPSQL